MKYISLFSGIGGFELGIIQAYENNIRSRNGNTQKRNGESDAFEQGMEATHEDTQRPRDTTSTIFSGDSGSPLCVGYSEIDKYATQIYQKHFPTHKNYGDITKINETELPDFDLLVGGFPCQSFSIAGKRGGFSDTRGTMFFEIARILKHKQPRLLLLENVKGLLSHDEGRTFATIISTLDELGYDLQWQVLNSKNFGVPQNRERVFIVGHLRGTSRPEVFPIAGASETNNKTIGEGVTNTLTGRNAGNGNWRGNLIQKIGGSQGMRVYDSEGISTTIAGLAGGWGAKTGLYDIDTKIRRLTPTECMRLQGFPDNWCDGISDTQKYKCAGNAVTVNVIQAIMEKLIIPTPTVDT